MCVEMEDVKGALNGMTASQATVATLQTLLGLETAIAPGKDLNTTAKGAQKTIAAKAASSRNVKPAVARTKKAPSAAIAEDVPKPLSPRERYALATETVNSGLRVLAEATKSFSKPARYSKDGCPATPTSASREALQPRSNNITPKRPSPEKSKIRRSEASETPSKTPTGPCPSVTATAECTRMAFTFLRSADTKKFGVREMPRLQLETGMLALVGKLIPLGLESMAVKELRHVKRRLESIYGTSNVAQAANAKTRTKPSQVERDTLASLLDLKADFGKERDALNLAVTYCMHTLRIVALSSKPAVVEEAAQYLVPNSTNSPMDLLCRQAKAGGQAAKIAKQLEALSQTITSLCPSPGTASDVVAFDQSRSAAPGTVFKLQTIVLQVRKIWWTIAGHQPDIDRELLEPFLRCALAFVRRSATTSHAEATYDRLSKTFASIHNTETKSGSGTTLFNIHNLLAQQAERAGRASEALEWARALKHDCCDLEPNHARKVSAEAKHAALVLCSSRHNSEPVCLENIVKGLESKLAGTATDFDNLLSCLHGFATATSAGDTSTSTLTSMNVALAKLFALAAGFALRYSRSYPGRCTNHVTAILNSALRISRSTEDLLSWVTPEAARVLIQTGTLGNVAKVASERPLAEAWETSSDAISLSRICRALLLCRVRAPSKVASTAMVEDEDLGLEERGALLELQLESAIQLTSKTKYHAALKHIVSDLLRKLNGVYTVETHPVRRARVAVAAFRLHETSAELLSAEDLAQWQDAFEFDEDRMGSDSRLLPYLQDIRAALNLSTAFFDGSPSFDQLKPSILSWSQLLSACINAANIKDKIDDPSALIQQLRMVASYLDMRGDEHLRLPVLSLLERIERLRGKGEGASQSTVGAEFAKSYLALGYAERAEKVLGRAENVSSSGLEAMQRQVLHAEYLLAIDSVEDCHGVLAKCKSQRELVLPDQVPKDQRRAYELLHAQAWLIHSKYALQSGSAHEALAGAKRSVKILNSMWAALERADGSRRSNTPDEAIEAEPYDPSVSNLAKGVSKLQLTPKDDVSKADAAQATKGATFWPLVPVLTKALMHLSDMYSHHGLFSEATYYSERAMTIAESVKSNTLLSRIRSHRANLLTLAGRVEEAELCLTQDEATELPEPSSAAVERLCAVAAVRTKEGSVEEALQKLDKAQQLVDKMASEEYIAQMEHFGDSSELAEKTTALTLAGSEPSGVPQAGKNPAKRPAARPKGSKPASKRPQPSASTAVGKEHPRSCYALSKIKADITLRAITLRLKVGQEISDDLSDVMHFANSTHFAMKRRVAEHLHLMARANAALESDVTLNVLMESTLSLPSFTGCQPIDSASPGDDVRSSSPVMKKKAAKSKRPAPKAKPSAQTNVVTLLQAARDCLLADAAEGLAFGSTAQTHLESSLLAKSATPLSAVCDQTRGALVHPIQESLNIDQARMKAIQCEREAVKADRAMSDIHEPLAWPVVAGSPETQHVAPDYFQTEYVDIIPKSWTAISLCLNEDASELYVARYRSGREPLILRLSFSRHKADDIDEEVFDYAKGKAEVQEIIELSNYTCHSSRNMDAKGAKNTWWSDREALDRRLYELLINMENIWFGGFKSIFAQDRRDEELLARFRKSFEEVLDRYLPSRQAAKSKATKLTLDDKVLELFIGLGHDQDGLVDLDEPMADLLYFVVDMLQFSSERNAYDEIDFDSMAVDVLDTLRSYHEAVESPSHGDQHLILVLDRRLQAFPWENMPCLQGESVSRVGSMQSLRECIVAMRSSEGMAMDKLSNSGEDCHIVGRTSGTYILNPSSDLKATQTMLSPALQSLKDSAGQPWSSIVNEAPDEQRFSTALGKSSVLLYFGHGAGSQYIRPRAIKRLEQCSEVVWLMGCSSGAVTENGDLEPTAVPHAYLLAGSHNNTTQDSTTRENGSKCLAVLATLWDVTDKDIDRFSLAVGEEWGLWPSSSQSQLPAKTPMKRAARQIVAPSTPQQAPKTPKTPKARKTPVRARSRSAGDDGVKKSLVQAVSRSRDACYLRYLNGAAAVVYGVPVYLGD